MFHKLVIFWNPVFCDLHRFSISVARVVVNNDGKGETALDPIIWTAGSLPKQRKVDRAVIDFARPSGPVNLWTAGWQGWPDNCVTA